MPDLHKPSVVVLLVLLFFLSVAWGLQRLIRLRFRPATKPPAAPPPHLPLTPAETVLSFFTIALLILVVPALGAPAFMAGTLLLALVLLRQHQLNPLSFWGLHPCPWGRTLYDALNAWLTIWTPMSLLAALSTILLTVLHIPFDLQSALRLFLEAETPWKVAQFLLLALVLAPLTEEILFRGLLYPALRVRLGPQTAALLNGLLFALLHLHAPSFLSLALLGYLLCRLFESTGRLPACILTHAFFNAGTCLFLILERYG